MAEAASERAPKRACSAPDCPNTAWARGLCSRHYQAEYRRKGPPCSEPECGLPRVARGLCALHYQRKYRQGDERCQKRRCERPAFSRGLCVRHYHRWYQALLRDHHVTSLKQVPDRFKDRIPGLRS